MHYWLPGGAPEPSCTPGWWCRLVDDETDDRDERRKREQENWHRLEEADHAIDTWRHSESDFARRWLARAEYNAIFVLQEQTLEACDDLAASVLTSFARRRHGDPKKFWELTAACRAYFDRSHAVQSTKKFLARRDLHLEKVWRAIEPALSPR
jgi:hypothetical protein